MKTASLAALILAGFLNLAPFVARVGTSLPALAAAPAPIFMRWTAGVAAVAGTYHAVSGASAVLASSTDITGAAGTRLSHQIKISDGSSRLPESWVVNGRSFGKEGSTAFGMPPGLSLRLSTAIISGVPSQPGTFSVNITAYEKPDLQGAALGFTLQFMIAGGSTPPLISTPPSGGNVFEWGRFALTVVASGTAPLSYQWRHNGISIPGAGAATLVLDPVRLADQGEYTVIVSNSAGSVASPPALLNVIPLAPPVEILTQPADVWFHAGDPVALSVTASASEPLTFQWRRDGGVLPGQTSPTIFLPTAVESDSGQYDVLVSAAGSTVASDSARVTLVPLSMWVLDISDEGVRLGLGTIAGREYLLEGSDGNLGGGWQLLQRTTASGDKTILVDSAVRHRARFWRYGLAPAAAFPASNSK